MAVNKFVVLSLEYNPRTHSVGELLPIAVMDTREQAVAVLGARALESMEGGYPYFYCISELSLEMP